MLMSYLQELMKSITISPANQINSTYIQITFEKVSVNSCIISLMMSDLIVCCFETIDIFLIRMSNGLHNCTFVTP